MGVGVQTRSWPLIAASRAHESLQPGVLAARACARGTRAIPTARRQHPSIRRAFQSQPRKSVIRLARLVLLPPPSRDIGNIPPPRPSRRVCATMYWPRSPTFPPHRDALLHNSCGLVLAPVPHAGHRSASAPARAWARLSTGAADRCQDRNEPWLRSIAGNGPTKQAGC